MLAVRTENSTLAASGFAGSATTVPEKSLKCPRTLLIMWRIWKLVSECTLSTTQVSARAGLAMRTAAAAAEDSLRVIILYLSPWKWGRRRPCPDVAGGAVRAAPARNASSISMKRARSVAPSGAMKGVGKTPCSPEAREVVPASVPSETLSPELE